MYMLEMGQSEKTIALQAIRAGQPIPERIRNAPTVPLGLELYLVAFFDLDSERTHNGSVQRIPWTSMAQYANAYGFSEEQTMELFHFVKKMDAEHCKRLEAKMKAEADNATKRAKGKGSKRPR